MKLYSKKSIVLACFVGSPIAASILMRKNYVELGKRRKGLLILILGIIATSLIYWAASRFVDMFIFRPIFLIALIPTGITFLLVLTQQKIIRKQSEDMISFYDNRKAMKLSFYLLIAMLILFSIFHYKYLIWDSKAYIIDYQNISQNVHESILIFDKIENAGVDGIIQFIEQTAIPNMQENQSIIEDMDKIKFLPAKYKRQKNAIKK